MATRTLPPSRTRRRVISLSLSPSSSTSATGSAPPLAPKSLPPSPISSLPAEVLALIIEFAGGCRYERKPVLVRTALVARAWREPSQRLLFRHPWIISSLTADRWLASEARKRYRVTSAALSGSLEGIGGLADRMAGRIDRTLKVCAELHGVETLSLCLYTAVGRHMFELPALSSLRRLIFEDEGGVQTPASCVVHHIKPSFSLESLQLDGTVLPVIDAQFHAFAEPGKLKQLSLSLPESTPFTLNFPGPRSPATIDLPLLLARFPLVAPSLRTLALTRSAMTFLAKHPHLLHHCDQLEELFFKSDVIPSLTATLDALPSECPLTRIKMWCSAGTSVDDLIPLLDHPVLAKVTYWKFVPSTPTFGWYRKDGNIDPRRFEEACSQRGIKVAWDLHVSSWVAFFFRDPRLLPPYKPTFCLHSRSSSPSMARFGPSRSPSRVSKMGRHESLHEREE
ncbi:hypothetical protein BCR35DRAFT_300609 [Leucosporidium creatinivorum]|uniref:F-box domain-containing protein n=1 Tax=Leucosporidium creatinivorum TaxID=106004 RepID=A0A1Y2FZ88_9BASI|nr:hypothetical protein BCR35DRAFT_300609 [Leucosporidium creatinivorum]